MGGAAAGRNEFARQMEQRRQEEEDADYREIRQGWCLGSEEFRKELLAATTDRVGRSHYGSERQEAGEERAERLVRHGLKDLGWDEKDLAERRKGDPGKVELARRLRQVTTMTLRWISNRLQMGSWTYVFNLLNPKSSKNNLCK